ncbi:unnamed protein product [Rhodiola kirilowii]
MVNSVEATKAKAEKEKVSAQQPCFLCASTRHSTKNCPKGKYEDDDDGYEEAHFVNQQRSYTQNASPITRNYEPPQRRMSNDSYVPPRPQGQNNYQGNYQRQEHGSNQNQGQNSYANQGQNSYSNQGQGSNQNSQYSQGNYQKPYQAKSNMNEQGNSSSNAQDNSMLSMMAQMLESNRRVDANVE